MIENRRDREATKRARKAKQIQDPRSYINIAGHIYLRGRDRSAVRELVKEDAKGICAICKTKVQDWDADMDHIRGKRKHERCDCYGRQLPDGTTCTNLQWVHGMFSRMPCHRRKHGREIWSSSK